MTPKLIPALVLIASISASASGCGGSVPLPPGLANPLPPYVDLPERFGDGGRVTLDGEARTIAYTGNPHAQNGTASLSESLSRSTRVELQAAGKLVRLPGDPPNPEKPTQLTYARNGQELASYSDPRNAYAAFDSQVIGSSDVTTHTVFGAWLTGVGTGQGSFSTGSFGQPTRDLGRSEIPDEATYTGRSEGFHVIDGGKASLTTSQMEARVNFETKDVTITSRATKLYSIPDATTYPTPTPTDADELNFSGSTRFSGVGFNMGLQSTGGDSGSLSGSFHGRSAQEVGGTFQIDISGGAYAGSFGAER